MDYSPTNRERSQAAARRRQRVTGRSVFLLQRLAAERSQALTQKKEARYP